MSMRRERAGRKILNGFCLQPLFCVFTRLGRRSTVLPNRSDGGRETLSLALFVFEEASSLYQGHKEKGLRRGLGVGDHQPHQVIEQNGPAGFTLDTVGRLEDKSGPRGLEKGGDGQRKRREKAGL